MKFKSDIEIQAGVEAGGSTGSNGQVLSSTGTGVAWINQEDITIGEAEIAKSLQVTVKNVSGGELTKGTVVHTAPTASPPSGNVIEVIAADYDDTTKMPAVGILKETIANEAEGEAVMTGTLSGIATDGFSIGDELYVGADGALTNVKPQTAGQLIQKIAVCVKSHASNGLIKIFGAGRSNDVPLPLYIDNANQRLGIGTTSPGSKLEVKGNTANALLTLKSEDGGTNDAFMRFFDEGGGGAYSVGIDSSDEKFKIAFDTDGNSLTTGTKLVMDTSGNVGIGTTDPGAKLEIRGTVNTDDCKIYLKENSLYGAYFKYDGDLNRGYIGGITGTTTENAVLSWSRTGSDLRLVTSGSTAVTIDSNRNVGIGTTSPSEKLEVVGNTFINGQIYGGVGAYTTGGTTDWNHSTNARSGSGYTLLRGNATNGPAGSEYYHPFSFEYSKKDGTGNLTQFAIPYNTNDTGMYFRSRYSSTWTGWTKIWTSNNDGSGSGLDADLLDGQQGSYYAAASSLGNYLPLSGGTLTGDLTIDNNTPRIDFKADSSGSNVGARIELNENGNLWVNAQGGKDLWLNWLSPTSPASKADLQVGDGNSGSAILTVQGSTRRVGINTTSPGATLHLSDAANSATTSFSANGRITMTGDGVLNWGSAAQLGQLTWDANKAVVRAQSGTELHLGAAGNASHMVINTSGNVGIGTTSPNLKLDVISGVNNGIRISATDTTSNWRDIDIRSYVSQAQANALPDGSAIYTTNPTSQTETAFSKYGGLVLQGRNDGNSSFAIRLGNGNGYATRMFMGATGVTTFSNTITATNFILSSDERKKTKIKDLTCNNISVNWKSFELKEDEGEYRTGVIAQELEKSHPEFVNTDDEGFKSVKYIDLLIAKIAELEARLEKAGL